MKDIKTIKFEQIGVSARSKQDLDIDEDRKNRIVLIITDAETVYKVHVSHSNARYLIEKLSLAIKLAK